MATIDFRAQARAVRAEARRKLLDYRRERRANMRVIAAPPPDIIAPEANASDDDAAETFAVDAGGATAGDFGAMRVSAVAAAFAEAAALANGGMTAAPEPEAVADMEAAPLCEEPPEPALPSESAPAQQPDAPTPAGPRATVALDTLPGVGPGLVWLLQKAGVDSVETLMASDPEALSERLGLVGRLVDVAMLQSLARAQV